MKTKGQNAAELFSEYSSQLQCVGGGLFTDNECRVLVLLCIHKYSLNRKKKKLASPTTDA